MEKREIPYTLYLYIHLKIYQRTNGSHIISLKDAKSFLYEWRIPKNIRHLIIKELELMDLIIKLDRNTIEIKRPNINIEDKKDYYNLLERLEVLPQEN